MIVLAGQLNSAAGGKLIVCLLCVLIVSAQKQYLSGLDTSKATETGFPNFSDDPISEYSPFSTINTSTRADNEATQPEAAQPDSSINTSIQADSAARDSEADSSTAEITPSSVLCDKRGTKKEHIDDARAGSCACKEYVTGKLCDECKPGAFDLQEWRHTGCAKCYCSGFSTNCELRIYPVTRFPVPVNQVQLVELGTVIRPVTVGLEVDEFQDEATYVSRNKMHQDLYWSVPSELLSGDQIGSYGLYLNWTQRFDSTRDSKIDQFAKLMIISTDGTNLTWTDKTPLIKNNDANIGVQLNERYLKKEAEVKERPISREDVMKVLSSIKSIFIRAVYEPQQPSTHIRNITMDVVLDNPQNSSRVTHLESCTCPEGYSGRSCELCAARFYREKSTTDGSATCKKCPCNDNEDHCAVSPNSSEIICNCNANFTGKTCEEPIQPPEILQGPSNITVQHDEAVTFNCSAANTSATNIRWDFTAADNGSSITPTIEKRLYRADDFKPNYHFQIARVSSKDEGWYTCVVFNSKGSVSVAAYLKVAKGKEMPAIHKMATGCLKVATGLLSFLCVMVIIPILLLWILDYRAQNKVNQSEIPT